VIFWAIEDFGILVKFGFFVGSLSNSGHGEKSIFAQKMMRLDKVIVRKKVTYRV